MSEELNEKRFRYVMDKLSHLDKLMVNMVNNYNEGMGNLAYVRFQNPDSSASISPMAYSVGPAKLLVNCDDKKFKVIEDKLNENYLLPNPKEDSEDEEFKEEDLDDVPPPKFAEESLEDFMKRMAKAKP